MFRPTFFSSLHLDDEDSESENEYTEDDEELVGKLIVH